MQFNLVYNKEMLVVLCIWVHDVAVWLAVSILMQTYLHRLTYCRSCVLSVAVAAELFGISLGEALCGLCSLFKGLFATLFFLLPSLYPAFFFLPLLLQCDGHPDAPVWGFMAGLLGLLAMGMFYCVGTG